MVAVVVVVVEGSIVDEVDHETVVVAVVEEAAI